MLCENVISIQNYPELSPKRMRIAVIYYDGIVVSSEKEELFMNINDPVLPTRSGYLTSPWRMIVLFLSLPLKLKSRGMRSDHVVETGADDRNLFIHICRIMSVPCL
jgi:hypothetical protein